MSKDNPTHTMWSRRGQLRTIESLGSGIYRVTGESLYYRFGDREDGKPGLGFIDMEGGPMWMVGDIYDSREITSLESREDGSIILYTKEIQGDVWYDDPGFDDPEKINKYE